jgi:hypothetical protein
MGWWEFGGELHNCASYSSEILKKLNENKKIDIKSIVNT